MEQIRNLILDMDGVLWHGERALPGLAAFFETLQGRQMGVMLATNNASKTTEQYVQKLARFGVTVVAEQVMTSALATAAYLADAYDPSQTCVYVIGQTGIRAALAAQGFQVLAQDAHEQTAEVVVVGLDSDVTYKMFAIANIHLRRGAAFVGCNPDLTYPSEYGQLPGNGALLALLRAATGLKPLIIGKPEPYMFRECLRRLGDQATGHNTAMVGDRLSTDIVGGQRAGLQTILVLSGITQRDELAISPIRPNYVYDDISALATALRQREAKK